MSRCHTVVNMQLDICGRELATTVPKSQICETMSLQEHVDRKYVYI